MRAGTLATWLIVGFVAAQVSDGGTTLVAESPAWTQTTEINVTARRWQFDPNCIEVSLGDHVRLVVQSADGTHGFVCKKLGIERDIPRGGEEVVIEFDATKAGRFPIRCSEYCGLGHSQMTAVVVVRNATHHP